MLCDAIFLSLPGQFKIVCFTMVNFQLDEYPLKLKFKIKTYNYIQRSFRKVLFQIAVWRHFWCCYPATGTLFPLKWIIFNFQWLLLVTKLFESHQIKRKNPLTTFYDLYENFSLKFLCDVIFPLLPS